MWSEVLGLDDIGVDDRFLELGGDSLQAARIAARVAASFKLAIPVGALLEAGTVAQMANVVAAAIDAGGASPPERSERIPRRAPAR